MLVPEGHEAFSWQACPVVAFRRSRIAQEKNLYRLRIVCALARKK